MRCGRCKGARSPRLISLGSADGQRQRINEWDMDKTSEGVNQTVIGDRIQGKGRLIMTKRSTITFFTTFTQAGYEHRRSPNVCSFSLEDDLSNEPTVWHPQRFESLCMISCIGHRMETYPILPIVLIPVTNGGVGKASVQR